MFSFDFYLTLEAEIANRSLFGKYTSLIVRIIIIIVIHRILHNVQKFETRTTNPWVCWILMAHSQVFVVFFVLLMCVFRMIFAIICSQISEALWFLLKGCSTFVTANIQCLRLRCCYWRTSMLRPNRRPVCSWWPLAPARIKGDMGIMPPAVLPSQLNPFWF